MSQVAVGPNDSISARPSRTRLMIVSVLVGVAIVFAVAGYFIAHGLSSSSAPTSATTPTLPPTRSQLPGGTLGGFAASGTVTSVDRSTGTFVVSEIGGSSVTVAVSGATTYESRAGTVSSFAQVVVGVRVAVRGSTSNGAVAAKSVVVAPASRFRGGFGGAGAPGAFGSVASVDASTHSFTVTTRGGTTVVVDVSSSTKYANLSGSAASFAAVKVGSRVAATGTTTANGTVDATAVTILPAGGFGGGFGGGVGAAGGGVPSQ